MSDDRPADWYTDPEDPAQLRYWDGSRWTEGRRPRPGAASAGSTVPAASIPTAPAAAGTGARGGSRTLLYVAIPVAACMALVVMAIIVGAIASSSDDDRATEWSSTSERARGLAATTAAPTAAADQPSTTAELTTTEGSTTEPPTTAVPTTTAPPTTTPITTAVPTTTAAPETTLPPSTVPPTPPVAPVAPAIMPAVVCMNLQVAQDTIQTAGVFFSRSDDATGQGRFQLDDSNWIVVGQTPAPGAPIGEFDAVLSVVKIGEPNTC